MWEGQNDQFLIFLCPGNNGPRRDFIVCTFCYTSDILCDADTKFNTRLMKFERVLWVLFI